MTNTHTNSPTEAQAPVATNLAASGARMTATQRFELAAVVCVADRAEQDRRPAVEAAQLAYRAGGPSIGALIARISARRAALTREGGAVTD